MMPLRCWDVVRVDFPYADEPTARPRPALVVAMPAATAAFGLVWVLMITSARHAPWPDDVAITDLTAAGLPHDSLIRTAKIATIDRRLVTTIGQLSAPDRRPVRAGLRRLLGDALERLQADRKRSARSSSLFSRATLSARLFQSG